MLRGFVLAFAITGLALTATASAERPSPHRHVQAPSTFSGTCQFSGTVRFNPPLTATPTDRDFATAAGPCSGSFTDRRGRVHQLSGTTVEYFATDQGTTSCEGGPSSTGAGYFRFPWGRLAFQLSDETRGPGAGVLVLTGRSGGSASGTAAVSASESPVQIAQGCAGAGLRSVPVDVDLSTTPSIAG